MSVVEQVPPVLWWGVVESRQDPLELRRVQVRIHVWHPASKALVPTADLPWALVPTHIKSQDVRDGAFVHGYFLDGPAAQFPVVSAAFPGIPAACPPATAGFTDQRDGVALAAAPRPPATRTPTGVTESSAAARYPDRLDEPTVPRLARGTTTATLIADRAANILKNVTTANNATWSEPAPAYAATYPYNDVRETESGHVVELDDTPGHERIDVAHRTGTYLEMGPDGSLVTKVVKDRYQVVMGDDFVAIQGAVNITVVGDTNLFTQGKTVVKSTGDIDVDTEGHINFTQGGGTASDAVVLVSKLLTAFANHKHGSVQPGGGQSGTPVDAWTAETIKSDLVSLSG